MRLHRDHIPPASIACSTYYYSSSTSPTLPPRPSFFAHFSALPSLHLLAREAAQASVVPARRAESFQSRGPPFGSSPLGPASASRKQASKCPRRNAKTASALILFRDYYWCRHSCAYRITLLATSLAGSLPIDFDLAGTAPSVVNPLHHTPATPHRHVPQLPCICAFDLLPSTSTL